MAVGIGMRSFLGLGEESVYGTPVAPAYWVEINSESLQEKEDKIKTNSLFRRGFNTLRVAQGARMVDGSIEFDGTFEGWLKLAKHIFGRIDTTNVDPTNAPTAKQHRFTIQDTLPTGLTFELQRDTTDFVTEATKSFIYAGCKLNAIDFSCNVGEILKIGVDIIAQAEARSAKSTAVMQSTKLAVFHQGKVTWGNDELAVHNISIKLNNNLERRPKFNSRITREPLPSGKVEVSGSFQLEFDTWSQYDDFKNNTERILKCNFLGDIIASTVQKEIRLTCNVTRLVGVRILLNSPGRIVADVDFLALRDSVNNELELIVVNTEQGI